MERDYNRPNIAIGTHKYPFAFRVWGFGVSLGAKRLFAYAWHIKIQFLLNFRTPTHVLWLDSWDTILRSSCWPWLNEFCMFSLGPYRFLYFYTCLRLRSTFFLDFGFLFVCLLGQRLSLLHLQEVGQVNNINIKLTFIWLCQRFPLPTLPQINTFTYITQHMRAFCSFLLCSLVAIKRF